MQEVLSFGTKNASLFDTFISTNSDSALATAQV
jgi:hypothetical protein